MWNFCLCSLSKVLRLAMDHADGAKCKIVFTSPEAMMEFSGEKKS